MKKSDRSKYQKNRDDFISAVCPGGEGAVLKIVGPRGLARSNRVHGVCGNLGGSHMGFCFAFLSTTRTLLLRAVRDRPVVFDTN